MKAIVTEVTISTDILCDEIDSPNRIVIKLLNSVAGEYLSVEGFNDDVCEGYNENPHEFYLINEQEIDDFAKICKKILNQKENDII